MSSTPSPTSYRDALARPNPSGSDTTIKSMESEDHVDAGTGTAPASPHASNGFPSEKPQTLTLDGDKHQQKQEENDSDEELETPNGSEASDDAVKILHQEIQGLRRERSELQRRLEEVLAEMEKSEVGTKALAAHASYLEGELFRTQEDLASASLVAEDAEGEANRLRSEIKKLENEMESIKRRLEEKIADLEMERGRKDGEIRVLKEELRVSEERKGILEQELKERSNELDVSVDALMSKGREAMEEAIKIRLSREQELEKVIQVIKNRNEELEASLIGEKTRREQDLEKTVKELNERNSELEGKIKELSLGSTGERCREMGALTDASCSKVSWAVVAAAAASSGTVAVAVTAIYLRHARQR